MLGVAEPTDASCSSGLLPRCVVAPSEQAEVARRPLAATAKNFVFGTPSVLQHATPRTSDLLPSRMRLSFVMPSCGQTKQTGGQTWDHLRRGNAGEWRGSGAAAAAHRAMPQAHLHVSPPILQLNGLSVVQTHGRVLLLLLLLLLLCCCCCFAAGLARGHAAPDAAPAGRSAGGRWAAAAGARQCCQQRSRNAGWVEKFCSCPAELQAAWSSALWRSRQARTEKVGLDPCTAAL